VCHELFSFSSKYYGIFNVCLLFVRDGILIKIM
jgi:hypothetical protein